MQVGVECAGRLAQGGLARLPQSLCRFPFGRIGVDPDNCLALDISLFTTSPFFF